MDRFVTGAGQRGAWQAQGTKRGALQRGPGLGRRAGAGSQAGGQSRLLARDLNIIDLKGLLRISVFISREFGSF